MKPGPWYLLRNSRSTKDGLFSIAFVGTSVVLLKVLFHGITLPGGFSFGTIDSGMAGVILAACLAPYTTKRVMGGKADAGGQQP